jgi:hypothetical protein
MRPALRLRLWPRLGMSHLAFVWHGWHQDCAIDTTLTLINATEQARAPAPISVMGMAEAITLSEYRTFSRQR